MVALKYINTTIAERSLAQYLSIVKEDLKKNLDIFKKFDPSKKRLDDFFFHDLPTSIPAELSSILKLVFTLSHGQASVERGFSVNNIVLKTNMKPESITARKIIIDHMRSKELQPHTLPINRKLLRSVNLSRQRYSEYLRNQKKDAKENEANQQLALVASDLKNELARKKSLVDMCEVLDREFVELVNKAEKKNDMSLLVKGNALKRKSEEKEREIADITAGILILQEKKRKLQHDV